MGGVEMVVGSEEGDKLLEYIEEFEEEREGINGVGNMMKNRSYEELEVG